MFKITQPPVIIFGKYSARDYSFPQNCLVVTSKGAIPRGWLEYIKLNNYQKNMDLKSILEDFRINLYIFQPFLK